MFRPLSLAASTSHSMGEGTLQSPIGPWDAISRNRPQLHHAHETAITAGLALLRPAVRRAQLVIAALGRP